MDPAAPDTRLPVEASTPETVPATAPVTQDDSERPASRASSITVASEHVASDEAVTSKDSKDLKDAEIKLGKGKPLMEDDTPPPPTAGPDATVPPHVEEEETIRSSCFNIRARIASAFRRRRSRAESRRPVLLRSKPTALPTTTPAQKAEMRALASRIRSGVEAGDDVRVLQLKYDAIVANAAAKPRETSGLFKEACSTDLLFLIDTTGSMGAYIEAAKDQVRSIMDDIKEAFFNEADVRIAVVSYKDHGDRDQIQCLDFTSSADAVRSFLDSLAAFGGGDAPEDVLGGINRALNASWTQQTRCIIHIADAPPHGSNMHNLADGTNRYATPGGEPHRLTYEPLMKQMVTLGINYALLRINHTTDLMAYNFLKVYAAAAPECKLLPDNVYFHKAGQERMQGLHAAGRAARRRGKSLQFEEQQIGTTYSALRHLVVQSVTTSASRTASRLSGSTARGSTDSGRSDPWTSASEKGKQGPLKRLANQLKAINEDDGDAEAEYSDQEADAKLETTPPQWDKWNFLDKTLTVEAYSTDVNPSMTLDDMLASDSNIPITATDLTIRKRSRPFAQGSMRVASYARTSASSSPLVVKSFKRDGKNLAHLADDMRCQVLCKAFALEFNARLALIPDNDLPPLDFVVATCLRPKPSALSSSLISEKDKCLSLEPFMDGKYVKYNSNSGYVNEELDASSDRLHHAAQAFSHFTYERSRGLFLVSDLQGVGLTLTDPAVHTRDPERFKLGDTNLGEAGFKFFFATHKCNAFCEKLGLEGTWAFAKMLAGEEEYTFKTEWGTGVLMKQELEKITVCANKMCRKIVPKDKVHGDEKEYPGCEWCEVCWPQLKGTEGVSLCLGGGTPGAEAFQGPHRFNVSRFYCESQGLTIPRECPQHR